MPNFLQEDYLVRQSGAESAVPASGTWQVMDMIWNTSIAPGQPVAWICTTAGTPGTWTPLVMQPTGVVANSAAAAVAATANIVSITGSGAYNLTLAAPSSANQGGLQCTFVNASSGTVTIVAGTGTAIVGLATVPTLTSGTFESSTTSWYRI